MEDQLEAIREKIHKLLLDCGCGVISVAPQSRFQDDAPTVKGQVHGSFHPKDSPDRTVYIEVRVHTERSSVYISDRDVSPEKDERETFIGDDAVEQALAFIEDELPKFC